MANGKQNPFSVQENRRLLNLLELGFGGQGGNPLEVNINPQQRQQAPMRIPFDEATPEDVPFRVPEAPQPPPGREPQMDSGGEGGGIDFSFMGGLNDFWRNVGKEGGIGPFIARTITGNTTQEQEPEGPPPEPIDLLPPEAFGEAGQPLQDQGFQDQHISQFTVPGFPGGEALEGLEFPTMDPQARDRLLEQMEATRPPEFEREDPETSALLASMGQGLMDAETVGEALLGAGTGAQTALAQHAFEQDERERAHQEARRQFDRQLAQVAFESEQALTQDQQRKADFQRQVEMAQANLDDSKARQMANLARISSSSDGKSITVTEPEITEDGDVRLHTHTYTDNDVEEVLDAELLSDAPTVGGEDIGERLASVGTTEKLTGYAVAGVVNGSITPTRLHQIQPELDIDTIWNEVQSQAVENVARQQGMDIESEQDLIALRRVDDLEDKVAIERWKAWMQLADQSPVVKQAILAASGHPISQRLAAQMGAADAARE